MSDATAAREKPLGPLTLIALGINGIVGVGIFVAPPQVASAFAPASGALLYLAIAAGCVPIALIYARLARAMPVDGGPALYASAAFGARVAQPVGGLVWLSALFSTAAVTRALAEWIAGALHRAALATPIALAVTAALAVANLRGLRLSAWLWTTLTFAKLAPLVAIAALGLRAAETTLASVTPSGPRGAAALAVLFALQGFEIVTLPAGQTRDASRTVPRATVASLLFAALLYSGVHWACARSLPDLAHANDAIADGAGALGGPRLRGAIALGVAASIGGITVGMHAMTPRYLAAIFADPASPTAALRSVVATAMLVAIGVAPLGLGALIDLSSVAVLVQYAMTAAAFARLAWLRRDGLARGELWLAFPATVVVVVLLAQARAVELVAAALAGALATVAARLASRRGSTDDAAPRGGGS